MTVELKMEILKLLHACRDLMIFYKNKEMVSEIEIVIRKLTIGAV